MARILRVCVEPSIVAPLQRLGLRYLGDTSWQVAFVGGSVSPRP
jgi:hypothetical protein